MAKDRARKLLDELDGLLMDNMPRDRVPHVPALPCRRALRLIREFEAVTRQRLLSELAADFTLEYGVVGRDEMGDPWLVTDGCDTRTAALKQVEECRKWKGVRAVKVVQRTIGPWVPA